MPRLVPLDLLAAGESGRVSEIDGAGEQVTRLEEIGLRLGACVEMLRPGRPCLIAIGNQRISMRCHESVTVFVEVP